MSKYADVVAYVASILTSHVDAAGAKVTQTGIHTWPKSPNKDSQCVMGSYYIVLIWENNNIDDFKEIN